MQIQWIAQPVFEDAHSFEKSFIIPITRGEPWSGFRTPAPPVGRSAACFYNSSSLSVLYHSSVPQQTIVMTHLCGRAAGQSAEATTHEKKDMIEALSVLHDFTQSFIHRKVRGACTSHAVLLLSAHRTATLADNRFAV